MATYTKKTKSVIVRRLREIADEIEAGTLTAQNGIDKEGFYSYLAKNGDTFEMQSFDSGQREIAICYGNTEKIATARIRAEKIDGPCTEVFPGYGQRVHISEGNPIYAVLFRGGFVYAYNLIEYYMGPTMRDVDALLDKGYIVVSEEVFRHCMEKMGTCEKVLL